MSSLPQFTICLMNGSAMGGGFGLVCACDYVIATKQAHATLSEVKLGVIPAVISPHVSRTIGTANCNLERKASTFYMFVSYVII